MDKDSLFCVNCNGLGHPASYRGCPRLKELSKYHDNVIAKSKRTPNRNVQINKGRENISYATIASLNSNIILQKKVESNNNINVQKAPHYNNRQNMQNINIIDSSFQAQTNTDSQLEKIILRLDKIEQALAYTPIVFQKIENINKFLSTVYPNKFYTI